MFNVECYSFYYSLSENFIRFACGVYIVSSVHNVQICHEFKTMMNILKAKTRITRIIKNYQKH